MKYENLGKVVKRHASGMMETDKGYKYPAGSDVDKGDQLIKQNGKKYFVSADEFKEMNASNKPKFQKGVTKALRDEAAELGVEVFESTTKDELILAMEEARNLNQDGGDA